MDLPYTAEYAKSGRSNCRGCRSPIEKGILRLAVMVQSPVHDSKVPSWYHFECFFSKQRPKTEDDIHHFESLRIEDQKKIKEKLKHLVGIIVPDQKGKGKKRDASALAAKNAALKDFKIEYSKSSRAMCRGCENKIMKDEVRISKKDYESEVGMRYGGQDMWHHLTCFSKLRSELGYFESANQLPGFKTLSKDDQNEAEKQLPPIKQEDVPDIKKVKSEDAVDGFTKEESKLYKQQNKLMYKYRDLLEENINKTDMSTLLEENDQQVPAGVDKILDHLADIMTFGALLPCEVCKGGQFVFDKFGYKCHGNLTEWTKCNTIVKEPKRKPFKVPSDFAEARPFFKKYKYVARTRVVKKGEIPTTKVKKEEEDEDAPPKVTRAAPALYNMEFVILGQPERGKDELKKQILKLGGKVTTKIAENVMAVIASEADVEKMGARMKMVQENRVHVVAEDFVDEAAEHVGKIPDLVLKKAICDWGSDPNTRLPPEPSTSRSKSKSMFTKSMPSKVKLTLKGGSAVDPDSGLEHVAHVYAVGSEKYTAVLSKTDIQTKKNSFYKLQLLEADQGNRYWVFRAWGRIGTTIGGNKVDQFSNLYEAESQFHLHYEEKTGNRWGKHVNFKKVPGLFYPIDIDYGEENQTESMEITDSSSTLPLPVQNLIRTIFDVKAMKKVMLEFELDTEKMPLGKLSKKQIQNAYSVLNELQKLIDKKDVEAKFIDATNRFYTFIPHSFGVDNPPILNDAETIKKKVEMLDSLMELEIAYNLMKSTGSEHTVDSYYNQLKTEIDVLTPDSEEFEIIQEYVKNTHAATHSGYQLEVKDIFTIKREGEEKRFKPFKKLHNHKLLWHGSRTTNFGGILSQGLRIAPPEAPVTGYMFGKGIYFADMVSKSANYCCTSPQNPTGLLLLCDVALGNMYEKTGAEYVEKLPKGKHSTKGVGRTAPDPKASKVINGIEVPIGKSVPDNKLNSSLLYNEYIVYDIAQVNVKYLLKVDFKYKY